MSLVANLYRALWAGADRLNRSNILRLVENAAAPCPGRRRMLDLGCDDGAWTATVGEHFRADEMWAIEIASDGAMLAKARGIRVLHADVNAGFPLDSAVFDLVHANQVIEHVSDVDHFLAEVFRVLKPGGMALVSTENGSAWHNVFAAAMGWQIFSLTNVSTRAGAVGNPLALHRADAPFSGPRTHKTVFNYRGFVDIFTVHGFVGVRVAGAGYHPLPPVVGRWDPRHGHFITVSARRAP